MRNLLLVVVVVSFITAGLSSLVTCLVLGGMAASASAQSSACVDSMEITHGSQSCPFPQQSIEVYATGDKMNDALVKCVCPRGGR